MATRLFSVDLDLGLNKAKRFIFEDFSTTPSNGANAGRVIYWTAADSSANHLKVYNGTAWKTLAYTDDVPDISISLDPATGFNVTGSPAGATGTLTFEWDTVAPGYVLAGPLGANTSPAPANAIPTFRFLSEEDIPAEIARVSDVNTSLEDYILLTEKGQPLGVAELDASGYVPLSQLNITEAVQDAVIGIFDAGDGIGIAYDDEANIVSFENTGVVSLLGTTNEVEVTNSGTSYTVGLPDAVSISNGLNIGGTSPAQDGYLNLNTSTGTNNVAIFTNAFGGGLNVLTSGSVVINGNGEYLGSVATNNQIATIGDISSLSTVYQPLDSDLSAIAVLKDNWQNQGSALIKWNGQSWQLDSTTYLTGISNVDNNLSITNQGGSYVVDLASNINISGDLAVNGGDLTTTTTGTFNILGSTLDTLNIGGKTENIFIGYGNETSTVTVRNDLVVTGDLTVQGSSVILNTETLAVEDNIVVLNSNVSGTPTINAGIEVERGTETNASVTWDETAEIWKAGLTGSEFAIARKYVTTTTGTTHTITHNLNTQDVTVNCWVGGEQVEASVLITDANTVTVTTNSSLTIKTVVVG